jgi:hypothetical protein
MVSKFTLLASPLNSIQTSFGTYLSNGYKGGLSQVVKRPEREADHLPHLVPRSRMVELYLHSSIHLYAVVLN